ncbi:MAG: LuxR C-terminal-related transcriptional regulator [Actinomycetota bacterium]
MSIGGDVVLRAKLTAPEVPAEAVARTRLVDRLTTSDTLVDVVKGPAGYGKTTVVRQAVDVIDRPVAWVNIDRADDSRRFWRHVAAALDGAGVDLGAATSDSADEVVDDDATIDAIVAALELTGTPVLLVLDDMHEVGDGTVMAQLTRVLLSPPAGLRVMITTRSELDLPIARLLARGHAHEITAVDLAFTAEEGCRFLADEVAAGRLSTDDASEIVRRVDGWPAGLQLARLAARGGRSAGDVIDAASGAGDDVARYLAGEVLDTQPAAHRDFLIATSVLDDLTPDACEAASGQHGALRVLRALVDAQVFTTQIEPSTPTFRYHRMWREFLRSRLAERPPEFAVAVHRRLADWFATTGAVGESVRHRLLEGAVDRALDVLGASYVELSNRGQIDLLWELVAMVGPERVLAHEDLAPLPAWASLNTGRYDEIDPWLDSIEMVESISEEHRHRFLLHGATVRAHRDRHLGNVAGAVYWGRAALALLAARDRRDELVGPSARAAAGAALVLAGDVDAARPELRRAMVDGTTLGEASAVVLAEMYLAAATDDQDEQLRLASAALARCATPELDRFHRPSMAWLVLAEAALDDGRVGDAEHGVRRALEHARAGREAVLIALGEALCARVAHAGGDDRTRREALRRADAQLAELVDASSVVETVRAAHNATRFAPLDDALPVGARELTERELVILRLLPHGLSRRELAEQLYVSENTLKTHLTSIRRKLGVTGRASPVEAARALGLIDPE